MDSFLDKVKKNKMKLLKLSIIGTSGFFLLCSVVNLLEFSNNYFRTVVTFYLM